jgi:Putative polyhydroxyalkanoic acid system protein (PHA_gran_rgn)
LPDPIIVTISHRLGRDSAKRRLDDGFGHIHAQLAGFVNSVEYAWTGYRLDFTVMAMRQAVVGRIDIKEDVARIEFGLPLLLRLLANPIIGRIRREGKLLLDKPEGN